MAAPTPSCRWRFSVGAGLTAIGRTQMRQTTKARRKAPFLFAGASAEIDSDHPWSSPSLALGRIAARCIQKCCPARLSNCGVLVLPQMRQTTKTGRKAPLLLSGASGEIRTPDPQVRSLVLYPTELRTREGRVLSGGGPGPSRNGLASCGASPDNPAHDPRQPVRAFAAIFSRWPPARDHHERGGGAGRGVRAGGLARARATARAHLIVN